MPIRPDNRRLPSQQHQSVRKSPADSVDNANRRGEALSIQSTARIGTEKHCRFSRQTESGRRSPVDSVDGINPAGLASPDWFSAYNLPRRRKKTIFVNVKFSYHP